MAFQAPGRAILRYGNIATTLQADGKEVQVLRGAQARLDNAAMIAEIRERYQGLDIGPAPEPVFALGRTAGRLLVGGSRQRLGGWTSFAPTRPRATSTARSGQSSSGRRPSENRWRARRSP
jgi:hypothetical protein